MAVEMIKQNASDIPYLHRDFHNLFNLGLCYLHDHFGEKAVIEYLTRFAGNYYSPLSKTISKNGLSVLRDYLKRIYTAEEALDELEFIESDPHSLTVRIRSCPAIRHMKKSNVAIYQNYVLTSSLVYRIIAENAGYQYQLLEYDSDTGHAVHLFFKSDKKEEQMS